MRTMPGRGQGKSKLLPDCLRAFAVGGLICAFAQCLTGLYGYIGVGEEDVKVLVIMTLIFLTAMLTGMGIFEQYRQGLPAPELLCR